ncbi:hypothetical protein DL95DRAFT_485747 [Leptodontidium sp. 2 PMI_412]|nr:hypothetical protein DL95DRAFT_485747 [Leptodontidium sp. 2 PMI_412]
MQIRRDLAAFVGEGFLVIQSPLQKPRQGEAGSSWLSAVENCVEEARERMERMERMRVYRIDCPGGRDIDWGNTIQEREEDTKTERDYRNPKGDRAIKFCLDNKKEILDLHSSMVWTKVFELQCDLCQRFYKYCMSIEWDQFSIHTQIHCNRPGKKECGIGPMSLVRPNPNPLVKKVVQEKGLKNLAAAEVVVKVVEKKMSQKERKKVNWEARALAGF